MLCTHFSHRLNNNNQNRRNACTVAIASLFYIIIIIMTTLMIRQTTAVYIYKYISLSKIFIRRTRTWTNYTSEWCMVVFRSHYMILVCICSIGTFKTRVNLFCCSSNILLLQLTNYTQLIILWNLWIADTRRIVRNRKMFAIRWGDKMRV